MCCFGNSSYPRLWEVMEEVVLVRILQHMTNFSRGFSFPSSLQQVSFLQSASSGMAYCSKVVNRLTSKTRWNETRTKVLLFRSESFVAQWVNFCEYDRNQRHQFQIFRSLWQKTAQIFDSLKKRMICRTQVWFHIQSFKVRDRET